MVHEIKEQSQDSLISEPLTADCLRQELQTFATRTLRHELAELRSQLRQDLEEELHNVQVSDRRFMSKGRLRNAGHISEISTDAPPVIADRFIQNRVSPKVVVTKPEGEPTPIWAVSVTSTDDIKEIKEPRSPPYRFLPPNSKVSSRISAVSSMTSTQSIGSLPSSARASGISSRNSDARQDSVIIQKSTPKFGGLSLAARRLSQLERASKQQISRTFRSVRKARLTESYSIHTRLEIDKASRIQKVLALMGQFFESTVSIFIIMNGIFIGVQTDYQARNVTEAVPSVFPVVEVVFCVIFTTELLVKLCLYRQRFFYMPGQWTWNLFDFFLVVIQLIEVIGMITSGHETESSQGSNPVGNVSFLRMLRILRLFRVLRLVRLLHFIGELATIISSIASCFRALCWTVLLLLMMIYVVAIVFTQVVCTHRVTMRNENKPDNEELGRWWGSLPTSAMSLYQSILGGVDWEAVVTPMTDDVSWILGLLFALYIAFALLAMMNIITGTFVQSALNNAENEKTEDFRFAAHRAFENEDNKISFEEFARKIDDSEFNEWMKNMSIEAADAKLLFQILDRDQIGLVEADKLINNVIRLREGAKFMDVMKLLYETERASRRIDEFNMLDAFEHELEKMSFTVSQRVVSQVIACYEPEAGAGRAPAAPRKMMSAMPRGSSSHAGDSAAGVPARVGRLNNRGSTETPTLEVEEV